MPKTRTQPPELLLSVQRENGAADQFFVTNGLTIGRGVANTVVLPGDTGVDQIQHARVEVGEDDGLYLCCPSPANTISQNGAKTLRVALVPGQRFQIGETCFECLAATRADPPTATRQAAANLDRPGCPYCYTEDVARFPSESGRCPTCGRQILRIPVGAAETANQFVPVEYGEFRAERFVARGGMGLVLKGQVEPSPRGPASPSVDYLPDAALADVADLVASLSMGNRPAAAFQKQAGDVAIKLLPASRRDAASQERFQREVALLSQIQHPNVVRLLTSGVEADHRYLVMEWIEGETLKDKITAAFAENRLIKFDEALPWFVQICSGLQTLHEAGIVHRDLKPSNILISSDKVARIVDLGIAKALDDSDRSLTTTGSAPGTFVYMAPEQHIAPETVDARADIYALGVTFLELLTGQLPLGAWKPASTVNQTVPKTFCNLLSKAMSQRQADRPQTIAKLLEQLAYEIPKAFQPTPKATAEKRPTVTSKAAFPDDFDIKQHARGILCVSVISICVGVLLTGASMATMMITGRLSSFFNAVVTVGVLFVAFAFVCLCMSSWLVTSRIWQAIWRLLARCFPKRLNSALAKLSVWVPDSLLKPVVASAEKRQARVRPPKLTWQEAASAIGWISLILVLNYFGFLDSNASRPKTNRNTSSKTWPSDSPGFNPVLPPAVSEYLPDPKYKTYPQSGTTQVSRLLVSNSDGSLKVPFLVGWSRQHDPADKTAITLIRRDPSTKIVIRRLPKYAPLSETARLVGPGYPSEGDISRRWSTTPIIQGFAAIQQETNYRAGTADRVSVLTIIDTKTPFVTVLVDCLAVDWRSVTPSYQQVLQGFKESESAPELDR